MKRALAAVALFAALAWAAPVRGQACAPEHFSVTDALAVIDLPAEAALKEAVARRDAAKARPNPRAAKQIQAPSAANPSASPVDAPSFTELLAMAIDSKLLNVGEQQALSASLNTFAFIALLRPNMTEEQYQSYSWVRRLDGQISLGGVGESFDRDGDGKADAALQSKQLSDSVSWEARLRVFGSRDRREKAFVERYGARVTGPLQDQVTAAGQVVSTAWPRHATRPDLCMTQEEFGAFLADPEVQGAQAHLHELEQKTLAAMDQSIKDLDRRLVVTLFASGTKREAELGPDKAAFGVRAGWGHGLLDHTLNLDWAERQSRTTSPDARTFKLGYEASGELNGAGFEGSKLSVFAAFERYSNVPNAKHKTVAKAGGKLDIRLADGLRLPLSVTWANHKDLLADGDEIVGNVAITLDLSDMRKKKTP